MDEKNIKRGIYSDFKTVDLGNKELIFVAGQIARDKNGAIAPDNIEIQAEFVFQSIEKILKEANSSLDDVVGDFRYDNTCYPWHVFMIKSKIFFYI